MVRSTLWNYDIWDCRGLPVQHGRLVHDEDIEDGLPNYASQQRGLVRVTICNKCHPRIAGHMNIEPPNVEQYFEIADLDALVDALPHGITGDSGSKQHRYKLLLGKCVYDDYNPAQGHAGRTFKLCLAYQWGRSDWQPRDYEIQAALRRIDMADAYQDAYDESK